MTDKTELKSATEIWFIAQRVLRTLVQVAIPAFLGFAVVLPQIIEAVPESQLRAWLLAVSAGVTVVAGALAKIMAIPAVNAWLIKLGLGSVPRSAIYVEPDSNSVQVKADPKRDLGVVEEGAVIDDGSAA